MFVTALSPQLMSLSKAEVMAATREDATHSVFVLRTAVPLATVAEVLGLVGVRPVAFEHRGETSGGFVSSNMSLEQTVNTYRDLYAVRHESNPEPRVISFRLEGRVPPNSLLGLEIIEYAEVPATATVAVMTPDSGSAQLVILSGQSTYEPPSNALAASSSTTLTGGKPYAWMPDEGTIDGVVIPEGPRQIGHSLVWRDQQDIAAFGENAYEHDLKLINHSVQGGPRPFADCDDDAFWAKRSDALEFDTTFPTDAVPYLDTELSDPCSEMDLTIGLFHPKNLSADTSYEIWITASGGTSVDQSLFQLTAQSLPNQCPGEDRQICVGLAGGEGAAVIDQVDGCVLPGSYQWVSGDRRSCPYGISRTSVSSYSVQGNKDSANASISEDGRYVAFASEASNLVPGDTNLARDVFLRDRSLGITQRISVSSSGQQANGDSNDPHISADGRYISFESFASNLISSDTNGIRDIFVRDRITGSIVRMSLSSTGGQLAGTDATTYGSDISSNGRFVAFQSSGDIFVHDRDWDEDGTYDEAGAIKIAPVSLATGGSGPTGGSTWPSISDNGRWVAFESGATNLVAGDTNDSGDVFVRDRLTETTERVSVSSAGDEGDWNSETPTISGDGRHVAFLSMASNLAPNDLNYDCVGYPPPHYELVPVSCQDAFVHDRILGDTRVASVNVAGVSGNMHSGPGGISQHGRYVIFHSSASDLVAGDLNQDMDVFVRDMVRGSTTRISVDAFGREGNGHGFADGVTVNEGRVFGLFESYASNLVASDTNGSRDVFVYEQAAT